MVNIYYFFSVTIRIVVHGPHTATLVRERHGTNGGFKELDFLKKISSLRKVRRALELWKVLERISVRDKKPKDWVH